MITYFFLRYLMKSPDCGRRVEADCLGNVHEFNDVQPPLARFQQGHVGLIAAQFLGYLHLREACCLALFNDELNQRAVSR